MVEKIKNTVTGIVSNIPKPAWIIGALSLGVSLVVLVTAVSIEEIRDKDSHLVNVIFKKDKELQHKEINLQQQAIEIQKAQTEADVDLPSPAKQVIIARLDKMSASLEALKDLPVQPKQKEMLCNYFTDLVFEPDSYGRFSKIELHVSEWHLTSDVPFPNPNNWFERFTDYIFLLCKSMKEHIHDKEALAEIKGIEQLNNNLIKKYKKNPKLFINE